MDYPVKTLPQLRPLLTGFRKAAGLTQAQVASHLGVTQQTYAQLEAKPESASIDRLFHVLKLLKVDIVLTQALGSANLAGRIPERQRAVEVPHSEKQISTKKRTTTPAAKAVTAKTTRTRKTAITPSVSGQGLPKPVARKRAAPKAASLKKREDW